MPNAFQLWKNGGGIFVVVENYHRILWFARGGGSDSPAVRQSNIDVPLFEAECHCIDLKKGNIVRFPIYYKYDWLWRNQNTDKHTELNTSYADEINRLNEKNHFYHRNIYIYHSYYQNLMEMFYYHQTKQCWRPRR